MPMSYAFKPDADVWIERHITQSFVEGLPIAISAALNPPLYQRYQSVMLKIFMRLEKPEEKSVFVEQCAASGFDLNEARRAG